MADHTFVLTREHVALCDLLKLLSIAQSGGHAKSMIAEGLVTVDGKIETRKTRKLTGGERVCAAGETVRVQAA
ncbi:RNA-binding S4 domain-containing protein [Niveibacterium sp. 24ML]|uniref:RNA-binding S4 domain-containing protein n=1 Tax=Niveibacterium sp. 24ML TaxID=2985512 RepID=UPI00226ECF51|nr:RNA-binding S4 domain-containing protein [Niveibacterium sp. 24ML]